MSTSRSRAARLRGLLACALIGCLGVAAAPALAGVTPPSPKTLSDVAIAKASDKGSYEPGETISYTITVTNTGRTSVQRRDVAVSDPMLADLAQAEDRVGGDDPLAPGESLVWTGSHVATADDCGRLANTATIELRDLKKAPRDGDASNDSATHWVDVAGACAPPPAVIVLAKPAPALSPSGVREVAPQSVPQRTPGLLRARRDAPGPPGRRPGQTGGTGCSPGPAAGKGHPKVAPGCACCVLFRRPAPPGR